MAHVRRTGIEAARGAFRQVVQGINALSGGGSNGECGVFQRLCRFLSRVFQCFHQGFAQVLYMFKRIQFMLPVHSTFHEHVQCQTERLDREIILG